MTSEINKIDYSVTLELWIRIKIIDNVDKNMINKFLRNLGILTK